MTTSRQRAQTLALDIVKKQDGGAAIGRESIVLMREYNGQTAFVRNRERNRERACGALNLRTRRQSADEAEPGRMAARHALGSSQSSRRKTKTEPLPPAADRDLVLK
jgi:hypothetical protein